MDFEPDVNLNAFREEVRVFLRERLPARLVSRRGSVRSEPAALREWQQILNAHGWGAPYWNAEHGGTGWSVPQRMVFDEECAAAGAPAQDVFAHKLLGPVLNHFATASQRIEHVQPILSGERLWCQGFSEPGAGSDLAALRTRAVRDGDGYVVEGQKIWTSYAHHADWIFLLVRTGVGETKRAGISFLLVDMKTPGITVRPIVSIDGCHHLNEVFFDAVRVPAANLVGVEGKGWEITKFLLNNEHAANADLPTLLRLQQQLRELGYAQRLGDASLPQHHAFALRLARYEAELRALSMLGQRVAAMEEDHGPAAQAMGSILKVRGTELQQKMSALAVESLGDYGAVAYPLPGAQTTVDAPLPMEAVAAGIATDMFFRRASTIYGGTSEVQRSIVARMMFQL